MTALAAKEEDMMEEPQPGQAPEQSLSKGADATAGRTRPIDAGAPPEGDAEDARAERRKADAALDMMKARGFGGHKGTEAD